MQPSLSFWQKALVAPALMAGLANAHTIFTTLYVNDKSQGDGTCVRMNQHAETCTSPISSISSPDMACGITGENAVKYTCPVPAGGKVTFEFRLWANAAHPGVIDISHKGPCSVYAKQVGQSASDMSSVSAAGDGWFKVWDEGYDEASGKWCTEKLRDADGLLSVRLPGGLPAGGYLLRSELLALHNQGDPQFFVGCAQVFVESEVEGELAIPDANRVAIPGHVAASDEALTFNIYEPDFPYPLPGPKAWTPPAPDASSAQGVSQVVHQTSNRVPERALIKNANWVGLEVSAYDTQDGCWASADECWAQTDACYDGAPPTGNNNCYVWEAKCSGINDACDAGNWQGPPNMGQKLQSKEPGPPGPIPDAVNAGVSDDRQGDGDGEQQEEGEGKGQSEEGGQGGTTTTATTANPAVSTVTNVVTTTVTASAPTTTVTVSSEDCDGDLDDEDLVYPHNGSRRRHQHGRRLVRGSW